MAQTNSTQSRRFWRKIAGLDDLNKRQFAQNKGRALGGDVFIPSSGDFLSNAPTPILCDLSAMDGIEGIQCVEVQDLFVENPPLHINGVQGLTAKSEVSRIPTTEPFMGNFYIEWQSESKFNKKFIFFDNPLKFVAINDLQPAVELEQRFYFFDSDINKKIVGFSALQDKIFCFTLIAQNTIYAPSLAQLKGIIAQNLNNQSQYQNVENCSTPTADLKDNAGYSSYLFLLNFSNLKRIVEQVSLYFAEKEDFQDEISKKTGYLNCLQIKHVMKRLSAESLGNMANIGSGIVINGVELKLATILNSWGGNPFYEFIRQDNAGSGFNAIFDYSKPIELFAYLCINNFAYINYYEGQDNFYYAQENSNSAAGEINEIAGATCPIMVQTYRNYKASGDGSQPIGSNDTGENANIRFFFNSSKFFGNAFYFAKKSGNYLKFENVFKSQEETTNEIFLKIENEDNPTGYDNYRIYIDSIKCRYQIDKIEENQTKSVFYGFDGNKIVVDE